MGGREEDSELLTAGTGRSSFDVRKDGEERDRYLTGSIEGKSFSSSQREIASELNVDPLSLPSIPMAEGKNWYKAFPRIPAIYIAISGGSQILYVGRAVNLSARWAKHHRHKQLISYAGVRIAWLQCSDPAVLAEIESALIKSFAPVLNETPVAVVVSDEITNSKTRELRVRMTDLEWEKLREVAEDRCMTISELIRYLARQQWDKPA